MSGMDSGLLDVTGIHPLSLFRVTPGTASATASVADKEGGEAVLWTLMAVLMVVLSAWGVDAARGWWARRRP